jgi:hypothetical protein
MGDLPRAVGRAWYAGASIEAGNAWTNRADVSLGDMRKAGSIFVGLDTMIGPLYAGWGHTFGGQSAFYLFLAARRRACSGISRRYFTTRSGTSGRSVHRRRRGARLDVGREKAIAVEVRRDRADHRVRFLERLGGAQRPAEVDALGGRKQFDGDDTRGVVRHVARRRAAKVAIDTWSSWFAEVGSESTLAGCASDLFSRRAKPP